MHTKNNTKKIANRIILIFVMTSLFLSTFQITTENVSATVITTVDSSVATQYGTPYNQRKIVRLNDSSKSLGAVYQDATGTLSILFSKSTNNGTTWGAPVTIFSSTWINQYSTASVCVGENNTIHVVYGWRNILNNYYYISYNYSTNNGTTWSQGRIIANGTASYSQNDPMVAVDSLDNVHIVWSGQYPGGVWNIRYKNFTKATGTWSSIINVTTGGTYSQYFPSIVIDNSDNVYIAWEGYSLGISGLQVRYIKKTGGSWGSVTQISVENAFDQQKVQMVVNSTDAIHLTWYGVRASGPTGSRLIRHRSISSAGTLSQVHNVSGDSPTSHCYAPTISIEENNKLHVIYYTSPSNRPISYSSSTDNGETWSSPTILVALLENRYESALCTNYPDFGNKTNRPKTGYCFIWTEQSGGTYSVKYYASDDLTWESLTPPTPPAVPTDYKPPINFSTDSTTNGTQLASTFINANITSSGNNTIETFYEGNIILRPTQDYITQLTVMAGGPENYQAVDEVIHDDLTSYSATSSTAPQQDIFEMENTTDHGYSRRIRYITLSIYARRTGVSVPCDIKGALNIDGSSHYSSVSSLVSTWGFYNYTWNFNPSTGTNFTWNDIDNLRAGAWFDIDGLSTNGILTQVYLTVNYSINNSHHYVLLDFNRDLLTHIRMDHTSGATVIDNSTWHNNGTATGSATQTSDGVFGDAFTFDGDGDYISIPTSTSLNNIGSSLTVSLFANSTQDYASFPNNGRGLFGFYLNANHRLWVGITKNNPGTCSNTVSIYDKLGSIAFYKSLSTPLPTNYIKQWHQYTFVFTATNVTCYIDGVYSGLATFDGTYTDLSTLQNGFTTTIGRGSWTSGTWDWYGQIDEFIISNRSINTTEIDSLYDASLQQYHYNFTSLDNGNYTFVGHAVNTLGLMNSTATRWSNISMQYAPTVTTITPTNGSTNGDLFQVCEITVYDENNDTVNVTWQTNESGPWVTSHVDHNVASGNSTDWRFMVFNHLVTTYYWRVWLNDSMFNVSFTYHFTTGGTYFSIDGLTNDTIDWAGIAGSSYWNNDTGTHHETMEVTMSVGPADEVTKVGVWLGDLSIVHTDDFSSGWNNNVFIPEWAIESCQSDDPETIFESVHTHLINVTEQGTGLWWNRTGTPTLLTIRDDRLYNVYVNATCQLYIVSGVKVNASNVSIQFSGDNITWGANTRAFEDGGSEIFVNNTLWLNVNGCYGINPFGAPISGVTAYMYCRFKLNLPMYLPSNYTYYSLSAINWKMNFYEGDTGSTFLPLNLPATLPATGHFSTKWSNTSLLYTGYSEAVADDVNNDGYMEIFWCGVDSESTPTINVLTCFNPLTGKAIWQNTTTIASDIHQPLVIYDFDKDGTKEIIRLLQRYAYCYNAFTGAQEWRTLLHSDGYVQHHFAYLDKGNEVYIYFATGDSTAPYDARIDKVCGSNGTIVASTPMYYSCYGGTSIADLDNDGKYEILVTDRKYDYGGLGGPGKGIRCYDEDLNLLWYYDSITASSHCANLIDVNNDGDLEVVTGNQGGAGGSTIYVFNPDGTIQRTISGASLHITMSCGDIDNDGHIECLDGFTSASHIYDLFTGTLDATLPVVTSEPPDIGNVILDAGESDTKSEIMLGTTSTPVYKYNSTTSTYQFIANMGPHSYSQTVADFDWDGYNEVLLPGNKRIALVETRVPALQPGPRVSIAFDGERRINNGEYYEPPYAGEGLIHSIGFGGRAGIPAISADLFISDCNSQHDLIEYNGFYNLGNYTTYINTTIYLPTPWDIEDIYLNILNDTSVLYENITSGFTTTTINTTHKSVSVLYNPTTLMTGLMNCSVNVYVTLTYSGVTLFTGNKSFPDVFSIHHIDPPYNGSSFYNTTTQALNMSWDHGNYTDRYIVVRKTGVNYPTTPSDGTVVQNDIITTYNESTVASDRAYSVFGYNETTHSYSEALNIPWGAIGVNCFNESNPSQAIPFDLEVTNQAGTIVYKRTGLTNTHYIDVQDIPYGINTIFILESTGYKQRIYYKDISLNTFYNYSFYLPPEFTQGNDTGGGGTDTGDCTLRLATNSINISTFTVDAVIALSHEIEDMVSVEIYNRTLYISYGGWLMIPESKYTVSSTTVTINKTVLDDNTTMARVSYYYMYCPGDVTETPLYYLRVVETIETEYSTYDRGVDGAKVTLKRYVNTSGIYVSVAELLTDANGYCNVYLLPGQLYKVLVTKTGYFDMLSDYIPAPANQWGQTTEKIFRIAVNETTINPGDVDYLFKNIIWSIEPTGIRHPGSFTVWYNITSSDNKLEWYSMRILYYNDTNYTWYTIFYQNESNAGGGSISYNIPNVTGKYAIKCYFKKTGFPAQELGETGSLIHFIQYLQNWMHGIPDYAYYIVLIFIMVVAMGFFFIYFGTGLSTGYIGLIIFAIGLFIHPISISIGTTSVSGWIIFAVTFLMYSMGVFLWTRI